jgi:hypothetical protein
VKASPPVQKPTVEACRTEFLAQETVTEMKASDVVNTSRLHGLVLASNVEIVREAGDRWAEIVSKVADYRNRAQSKLRSPIPDERA